MDLQYTIMARKMPLMSAFYISIFGLVLAAHTGPAISAETLHLICEGAEVTIGEDVSEGPTNHLRLDMKVDRTKLMNRNLSINRFRNGFEDAEAQHIFEPIAHQGEVWISYCNRADWPKECNRQRPAQRDLFVSQMSEPGDPLFLSAYVSCAFCPVSIFNVVSEDPSDIRFKMFEFDLVKGTCQVPKTG